MNNVMFAFLLSLMAGLSTGIGSLITLFTKRKNTNFLAMSLGFSAGVMVYVSLVELLPEAQGLLSAGLGDKIGQIAAVFSFFAGMILAGAIDKILPDDKNPHEIRQLEKSKVTNGNQKKLMRTGIITAVAITVHNFPEGIATFVSALHDPSVAIPIVLAIALHNIPEGISVAVPIYYATGSRRKALIYSFASGLAEPLGAIAAYFILMPFLSENIYGVLFAMIAGIMVFISFDELLPSAREYGEHHLSIYGMVAGMMVMAISLVLL
ncbi:MAG: zinc transporter ZupT [Oscillospiraceae bacterium]|nr:zinc transporter ZupT [Oscillospiraceae bacterium]